jgi:hypothetical protein
VTVGVDMDAPEDYARFYRRPERPPSGPFLAAAVPLLLDLFAELRIQATFFCIGRDARAPEGARWVRRLAEAGHEVANHSDSHPHAFRHLPREVKGREMDLAQRVLEDATGRPVMGFRAPAYDIDPVTLELLLERGYRYDSSLYPSPFVTPMKWLVRARARRWRVGLGRARHGLLPRGPRFVTRQGGALRLARHPSGGPFLLELPLAVVPGLRLPFYGTIAQVLGDGAYRVCLGLVRRGTVPVNYGIHAQEVAPGVPGVPGYGAPVEQRTAVLRRTLGLLVEGAPVLTLARLADRLSGPAAHGAVAAEGPP